MDSLGSLTAFVQAAETRSFTAAGRHLGVSASAIGKAVSRLEERLGTRLFHRSTRSISLTSEGALFLERARRILCELEAAELEIAQSREAPRGTLRVSLPVAGMLMLPTLTAFMEAYPDIELDLDFTDRLVAVVEEGFDVVLRTGDSDDSRLKSRTLGTFRHVVVGAPSYFTQRGVPNTQEDLMDHSCLHHKYPTTGKLEPWPLLPPAEGPPLDLPKNALCTTIEPLIYMAERGLGITCVPAFAVGDQLRQGTLVPVLEDCTHGVRPLKLLWPSSRHMSQKLRVFIDFLSETLVWETSTPSKGAGAVGT